MGFNTDIIHLCIEKKTTAFWHGAKIQANKQAYVKIVNLPTLLCMRMAHPMQLVLAIILQLSLVTRVSVYLFFFTGFHSKTCHIAISFLSRPIFRWTEIRTHVNQQWIDGVKSMRTEWWGAYLLVLWCLKLEKFIGRVCVIFLFKRCNFISKGVSLHL